MHISLCKCFSERYFEFIVLKNWTTPILITWWDFRSWVGDQILRYPYRIFRRDIFLGVHEIVKSDNVSSASSLKSKRNSMQLFRQIIGNRWFYVLNFLKNLFLFSRILFVLRSNVLMYRRISTRFGRIPCHHQQQDRSAQVFCHFRVCIFCSISNVIFIEKESWGFLYENMKILLRDSLSIFVFDSDLHQNRCKNDLSLVRIWTDVTCENYKNDAVFLSPMWKYPTVRIVKWNCCRKEFNYTKTQIYRK